MTKISISLVATLLAGTSMVHASQIQSNTPSAQSSPLVQQAAPFIELAQAQTEAQKKAAMMAEEAAKKAEMMAAEEATKKAEMMAAEEATKKAEMMAAEEANKKAEMMAAEEANKKAEMMAAEEATKKAEMMAAEEATKKAEMMAAEEATKKAMMMAADSCDAAEFSVTGFSNAVAGAGSVSDIAAQINQMAGDNACAIEITGYSSTVGAKDLNMSLSTDRAEWVKSQLMEAGVNVSATSVTGAGETRQFGKNSANRRVVISVK